MIITMYIPHSQSSYRPYEPHMMNNPVDENTQTLQSPEERLNDKRKGPVHFAEIFVNELKFSKFLYLIHIANYSVFCTHLLTQHLSVHNGF